MGNGCSRQLKKKEKKRSVCWSPARHMAGARIFTLPFCRNLPRFCHISSHFYCKFYPFSTVFCLISTGVRPRFCYVSLRFCHRAERPDWRAYIRGASRKGFVTSDHSTALFLLLISRVLCGVSYGDRRVKKGLMTSPLHDVSLTRLIALFQMVTRRAMAETL